MNHYLTEEMIERLFQTMRQKGKNTSDMCKVLNAHYCDFKATLDGKSPCYGKWQRKMAQALETDRKELFCEFYE